MKEEIMTENKSENTNEPERQKVKFTDLFWLFMIGNFSGVIIEGVICFFAKGHWENHVTLLWGPFNLVYGIAAVFIYLMSGVLKKRSSLFKFAFFAFVCTALELAVGIFQEKCLNSISWDYSNLPFNFFGGKICLLFSFGWGFLGIVFSRYVFAPLDKLLKKNVAEKWKKVSVACIIFITVDIVFSSAVLFRWTHRPIDPEPANAFESFIDKRYTDKFMQNRFCEWILIEQ